MKEALPKCYHVLLILRVLSEHSPRYVGTLYRAVCGEEGDENCRRTIRAVLSRLEKRGLVYRKREKYTWRWVYGLTSEGRKLVSILFIERPAK
jgi:DNA-binding HxlR family transcriptional regulator